MDYFEIGQRIRKIRKARNLSQEPLPELAGISTTHMSHIETGNTKLSLSVIDNLASALEVSVDSLLHENGAVATETENRILNILHTCNARQLQFIENIVRSIKTSMDAFGF